MPANSLSSKVMATQSYEAGSSMNPLNIRSNANHPNPHNRHLHYTLHRKSQHDIPQDSPSHSEVLQARRDKSSFYSICPLLPPLLLFAIAETVVISLLIIKKRESVVTIGVLSSLFLGLVMVIWGTKRWSRAREMKWERERKRTLEGLQQDHTALMEEIQKLKIEILRRGGVPGLGNQALGSHLDEELEGARLATSDTITENEGREILYVGHNLKAAREAIEDHKRAKAAQESGMRVQAAIETGGRGEQVVGDGSLRVVNLDAQPNYGALEDLEHSEPEMNQTRIRGGGYEGLVSTWRSGCVRLGNLIHALRREMLHRVGHEHGVDDQASNREFSRNRENTEQKGRVGRASDGQDMRNKEERLDLGAAELDTWLGHPQPPGSSDKEASTKQGLKGMLARRRAKRGALQRQRLKSEQELERQIREDFLALAEDEREIQEDAYYAHHIQNNWRDSDTMELCSSNSTPRVFRPAGERRSPLEPPPEFRGGYVTQVVDENGVVRNTFIPVYLEIWAQQILALEHLKEKIDRGDYIVPRKVEQFGKKLGSQSVRGWIFWLRLQARDLLSCMLQAVSKRKLSPLLPIMSSGFPTVQENPGQSLPDHVVPLQPSPKATLSLHTISDANMDSRSQLFVHNRRQGRKPAPPPLNFHTTRSARECAVPASASINENGCPSQQESTLGPQTLAPLGLSHHENMAIKCTNAHPLVISTSPTSAFSSEFQEIPFSGRGNLASRSASSPTCKAGYLHYMSRESSSRRTKCPQATTRALKERDLVNSTSVRSFITAETSPELIRSATTPFCQEQIVRSRMSMNQFNCRTTKSPHGNSKKIKNGRQGNMKPSNLRFSIPQRPPVQLPLVHSLPKEPQKAQYQVLQKRHQSAFPQPWNSGTSAFSKYSTPHQMMDITSPIPQQEYLNTFQDTGLPLLDRLSAVPETHSSIKHVKEPDSASNGCSSNIDAKQRESWTAEDENLFTAPTS